MTLPFARVRSGVCGSTPEPADIIHPGGEIPVGKHVSLPLDSPGRKSFFLEVDTQVRLGPLHPNTPAEEFDLQLANADGGDDRTGRP